jgi:hypothetical protein
MEPNTVWLTVNNELNGSVIVRGLPGGREYRIPPDPNKIKFTGENKVKFSLKPENPSGNKTFICLWTNGDLEIDKKKNEKKWKFKVNFPVKPVKPVETTNVEVGVRE